MSALPQSPAANDLDSLETQEWLDALEAVLEREGPERAHYLLEKLIDKARRSGRLPAVLGQHRLPQYHSGAHGGALAGRSARLRIAYAQSAAGTR